MKEMILCLLSIFTLIIFNYEFPKILQHDIHVLQNVIVCCMEDLYSQSLEKFVTLCVIIHFFVVRAAINFHNKSEFFYIKVNDIVSNDFLSVEIKFVERLLTYLRPENDFRQITRFAVFTSIT